MIIAAKRKKVSHAPVLPELLLWNDATARDGPENMAVDEWLWKRREQAILRVYRWAGDWMSIGYFSNAAAVPAGRAFVRRPTGGGLVDHREDWTYTLIIPRGHALAEMPGAASYEIIHRALSEVLAGEHLVCQLKPDLPNEHSDFCFRQPVRFDLVDDAGRKIAGAGQRRGRQGLLHQGSVQVAPDPQRGRELARCLAVTVVETEIIPDQAAVDQFRHAVYQQHDWNHRR